MYKTLASLVLAFLILWIAPAQSSEATAPAAPPVVVPNGNVMAQLSTLRDNFISTIKSSGFQPSLPPPTILLDNPPSYGDFEEGANELHISVWSALTKEQQGRFERLSELLNNGKSAEQTFDESVHHWIFVHELGHWWQACQHEISANHYSVEYGANRIAAAYWRQTDPNFMSRVESRMTKVIGTLQSPLPEGVAKETYFNANYDRLGPTPDYIWFQYTMVLSVQRERPPPSFAQTLRHPVTP
jgi:hypothetical protein